MSDNRVARSAARARWARINDREGYPEALAEHQEARIARAIAEASKVLPGMPQDRKLRLIRQLQEWDGVEPGSPDEVPQPTHVSFNFYPFRKSVGEVIHRTPKTLRARFTDIRPAGEYLFTKRSDGLYRLAGRSLEDQALDFISDPDNLL